MTAPEMSVFVPPGGRIPPRYEGLPNAATFGRLISRPNAIDPTAKQFFIDWLARCVLIDGKDNAVLRPELVPIGSRPIPAVLTVRPSKPTIVKVAGDSQTAKARAALPIPLRVQVKESHKPMPGVPVLFEVGNFGATIGGRVAATRITDANGEAEIGVWILGPQVGEQVVDVTVAGSSDSFTATAIGKAHKN